MELVDTIHAFSLNLCFLKQFGVNRDSVLIFRYIYISWFDSTEVI